MYHQRMSFKATINNKTPRLTLQQKDSRLSGYKISLSREQLFHINSLLSILIILPQFNMKEKVNLSASLEDYIEAIYHIIQEKLVARSKEIAARLDVSRASVTEALRALSKKGLINYAPYEAITLTEMGKIVAEDVIFRHEALKKFFIEVLAIDDTLAEEGACKIEHAAPPEIIGRMIKFIEFMQICPRGGEDMIKGFTDYCTKGQKTDNCEDCVSHCIEFSKDK